MEEEIWKDIIGFEQYYSISNLGRCYSKRSGKCIVPSNNMSGYLFYNLHIKGVSKIMYAHRLVAIHFLDNDNDYPEVNHINGKRGENRSTNLEWCTKHENIRHSLDVLKTVRRNIGLPNYNARKRILIYNENNEVIKEFESVAIAAKSLGMKIPKLSSHMTGNRPMKTNLDLRYGEKVYIKQKRMPYTNG